MFKEARENLSSHKKQVFNRVKVNSSPDERTLSDLQADRKNLQVALEPTLALCRLSSTSRHDAT